MYACSCIYAQYSKKILLYYDSKDFYARVTDFNTKNFTHTFLRRTRLIYNITYTLLSFARSHSTKQAAASVSHFVYTSRVLRDIIVIDTRTVC